LKMEGAAPKIGRCRIRNQLGPLKMEGVAPKIGRC
jgi:hypothetical protein